MNPVTHKHVHKKSFVWDIVGESYEKKCKQKGRNYNFS